MALHLRAVFDDGSESFAYTAETEEEIRFKIKQAYFEKSKANYVLVSAYDDLAVVQAKKDAKRRKLEAQVKAAEERKLKNAEKKVEDEKAKLDAMVAAKLVKIQEDLAKARSLI